jgi:hypothetical protein
MKDENIVITKDNFNIVKGFLTSQKPGFYKDEGVENLFNKVAAMEIKKYTQTNEKEYLQSIID